MKKRLAQWVLCSGVVSTLSLAALMVSQRTGTDVAEVVLNPWFALCDAVTPDAWQTRGNILLGLAWLISGVVAWGAVIGALCVAGPAVGDRLRRSAP